MTFKYKAKNKNQVFIGIGFYAMLIALAALGRLSWLVFGWYGVMGVFTFAVYAKDKSAAINGRWRTPESFLHFLSVIGGWVGAIMAQNYLRHKSQKPAFKVAYYLTVIINFAILLFVLQRTLPYQAIF